MEAEHMNWNVVYTRKLIKVARAALLDNFLCELLLKFCQFLTSSVIKLIKLKKLTAQ